MKVTVRLRFDSVWRTDIISVPLDVMEDGPDKIADWLHEHFRSKGSNTGAQVKPPVLFYVVDTD